MYPVAYKRTTLDIFLIFLTAEEEDAARSESMGGRKNLGLDAGSRLTVNVSALPARSSSPEEARLDRLLSEWFPSPSCRNESLLLRELPWIDCGCQPRRLLDCPILLKAAPLTHDSEDDKPSLSKDSIPSIHHLSGHRKQTQPLFLPSHSHSCWTFLPVQRCVNTWRHLPRIRRGCSTSTSTTPDCYCNCLLYSESGPLTTIVLNIVALSSPLPGIEGKSGHVINHAGLHLIENLCFRPRLARKSSNE